MLCCMQADSPQNASPGPAGRYMCGHGVGEAVKQQNSPSRKEPRKSMRKLGYARRSSKEVYQYNKGGAVVRVMEDRVARRRLE
jgi:hypothetical protein